MGGPYAVIGLGLVGGSLAKAIRQHGLGEVIGVDPDEATRAQALADGVVTTALAAPGKELARARVVVLCIPLGALDSVLSRLELADDVLLTDVIGIKGPVETQVLAVHVRFVGAHPMAGGEHGGYTHSKADLFAGKSVAICPPGGASPEDVRQLETLWRTVGGVPVMLSAQAHDEVVAATSHLPYLSALGLVRVAAREPHAHIAGRGFFDATRRADFSPQVMAAVVAKNPSISSALRAQAAELIRLAELIEQTPDKLLAEAEDVRTLRAGLSSQRQSSK